MRMATSTQKKNPLRLVSCANGARWHGNLGDMERELKKPVNQAVLRLTQGQWQGRGRRSWPLARCPLRHALPVLPTYYDCHRAPALWPLLWALHRPPSFRFFARRLCSHVLGFPNLTAPNKRLPRPQQQKIRFASRARGSREGRVRHTALFPTSTSYLENLFRPAASIFLLC
jgi:hypothetical protein